MSSLGHPRGQVLTALAAWPFSWSYTLFSPCFPSFLIPYPHCLFLMISLHGFFPYSFLFHVLFCVLDIFFLLFYSLGFFVPLFIWVPLRSTYMSSLFSLSSFITCPLNTSLFISHVSISLKKTHHPFSPLKWMWIFIKIIDRTDSLSSPSSPSPQSHLVQTGERWSLTGKGEGCFRLLHNNLMCSDKSCCSFIYVQLIQNCSIECLVLWLFL